MSINILHGVLAGMSSSGGTVETYALPTTGLLLDIDATTGITTSGDVVTAVTERSPYVQPITVLGPVVLDATAINGRPAINTTTGAFVTTNSINVAERTYYSVVSILANNPDGFNTIIYQNAVPYFQLYTENGGNINLYMNTVEISGIVYTVGVPMIIKTIINTTTNQITVNGVVGTLNTHDAITSLDLPFRIANAGSTARIHLGRQVLYSGSPSAEDNTLIINTLKAQWGITF